jgi:hypothetical protein
LGVVSVMESGENWRLKGCKTASGVLSTSNQSTYIVGHRLEDLKYSAISWGAAADNSVGVRVHVITVLSGRTFSSWN